MLEGILLELFHFSKTLEELDEIDVARLSRALSAIRYRDAWERTHNRIDSERAERLRKVIEERDAELTRELQHLLLAGQ